MTENHSDQTRKQLGRRILIGVVAATVIALLLVTLDTERNPRTDDASVRANFIEIAPEVSGRLAQLPVKDNAFVKQGDLLFVIDPRDYDYALQEALSDQENLEQRIIDTKRKIAAQKSAAEAAAAAVHNTTTAIKTAGSGVDVAKTTVLHAQAAVTAAEAQLEYANNDLHRLEPLLQKQYVTVDQIDQANTAVKVARGNYDEALAALGEAQAQQTQATLRRQEADAQASESQARLGQSIHIIDTLDILESQRPGLAARVDRARLDLERCRVVAPFDAYVTNMNISEGAYAPSLSAAKTYRGGLAPWQTRRMAGLLRENLDGQIGLADLRQPLHAVLQTIVWNFGAPLPDLAANREGKVITVKSCLRAFRCGTANGFF